MHDVLDLHVHLSVLFVSLEFLEKLNVNKVRLLSQEVYKRLFDLCILVLDDSDLALSSHLTSLRLIDTQPRVLTSLHLFPIRFYQEMIEVHRP